MANLKNIVDLPMAASAEGLNLIVNDNGAAKQFPAEAVGKVKTVNGVEPDGNGNVEIEIPEGAGGSGYDMVITCRAIDYIYGRFDYDTMRVASGSYENVLKKLLEGKYVDIRFYCIAYLNEFGTTTHSHFIETIRYNGGEEIEMLVSLGSEGFTTVYMTESGEFHPEWD